MTVAGGEAITFASAEEPAALQAFLSNWLGLDATPAMRTDQQARLHQFVSFAGDRLDSFLHVAPSLDRVALDKAIALLDRDAIEPAARRFILAGRPGGDEAAASPLVCACFGVRRDAIEASFAKGSESVEAVGIATHAGTNCGSCRAEIRQLLGNRARVEP